MAASSIFNSSGASAHGNSAAFNSLFESEKENEIRRRRVEGADKH